MNDAATSNLSGFEQHAIIVASASDRNLMQARLRDQGLEKEIVAIAPGDNLAGRRFKLILLPQTVFYRMSAQGEARMHRWFDEQVRCRLAKDGHIVEIPS